MVHQLRHINAQLVGKMSDLLKYESHTYINCQGILCAFLTSEKEMYNSMKRVNDYIRQ